MGECAEDAKWSGFISRGSLTWEILDDNLERYTDSLGDHMSALPKTDSFIPAVSKYLLIIISNASLLSDILGR